MGPRFKYGDRVKIANHTGKVISIRKKNNKYYCTVLFDKPGLIPPQMEYQERHIKFENSYEEACPACGERWNIARFNMKVWKDCIKCNKTQEQLVKEDYEKKRNFLSKPKLSQEEREQELLREFEKMLEDDGIAYIPQPDFDDDDDFGFYDIGI
jgi:hypothetical protein